jgi:serine/threonine protein kinase/Leucine-rich repeat (LRR) protein
MTEEQVFLAALDQPSASHRTAYLDEACGTDTEFRRQVEALLEAHFRSGEFLETPFGRSGGSGSNSPTLAETVRVSGPSEDGAVPHANRQSDELDLRFLEPATRPDSLGRIGHYEVLQLLGKGGFGIVFRAFDDVLQRVVALKVLAPAIAATSPARKRFLREAQASARVRHENVVQVYVVEESPIPYLVMEFIAGETLQQRLDREGPLDAAQIVKIGRQIAEGLAAAHATGLIHRDIKPGNILIESGPAHRVKITDFGLARAADDASLTQSGLVCGTPMYMAPEQVQGSVLDQRADLFSLGSVLYVMTCGRPPFRAATTFAVLKRVVEEEPRPILDLIPETPRWLCDIITKLHAKQPGGRFQSAREVAGVLADCEERIKANSRMSDFPRIPPRETGSQKGRWKWAAGGVALLAVVGLGISEFTGATQLFRRSPKPVQQEVIASDSAQNQSFLQAPVTPPVVVQSTEGWVQLINGEGLTGWKTHPVSGGDWRVDGGILTGRGTTSYLFTESGDYSNFHLRVEAKINGDGDAGICFRTPYDVRALPNAGPAKYALTGGYEACIGVRSHYTNHTGSLTAVSTLATGPLAPHRPDEWFLLEVIAEGDHFRTLVDGKTTVDYHDEERRASTGHIALQTWGPGITQVQFRKIELKPLPPSSLETPPVANAAEIGRLRAVVTEKTGFRNDTRRALLAKTQSLLDVIYTEIDLCEARIELARAEGDAMSLVAAHRRLAAYRERERAQITQRVQAGLARPEELERADSSLGDTHARLASALENAPASTEFTATDFERIAALPADEQVDEVSLALVRLNPGFDGTLTPTIDAGVVTGLSLSTDHVENIAPIRALKGLTKLDLRGTYVERGELYDLSPLSGLLLVELDCSSTQVADLSPLAGMPLQNLQVNHNPVSDLSPLTGMPLSTLGIAETQVADLSPLRGSQLKVLGAQLLPVTDLSPLSGLPLTGIDLYHTTGVTSLEPLRDMPLESLNLQDVPISDLAPLAGMSTLRTLQLVQTAVTDLSPLQGLELTDLFVSNQGQINDLSPLTGMPLMRLTIDGTSVRDLSPLHGMPLQEFRFTPRNIDAGVEAIRNNADLQQIGSDATSQTLKAAEFWERYDRGDFTN